MLGYGQALSRVDFAVAFAHFGITHGAGDGYSTFNAPDFRGRMSIGLDNQGGVSANRVTLATADSLGGVGGVESHAHNSGLPGTPGFTDGPYKTDVQNHMNPYMAMNKAFKFI